MVFSKQGFFRAIDYSLSKLITFVQNTYNMPGVIESTICVDIFFRVIRDYHETDDVDTEMNNPYTFVDSLEALLYEKCWVDTVQWHLEDIIRDPEIDPVKALKIKRRIDNSNQHRTDLVQRLDNIILEAYSNVQTAKNARRNTESPAWAIDRLSILCLKVYHMQIEATREDASQDHKADCQQKLIHLDYQMDYLTRAIDQLIEDISTGNRIAIAYNQMKMYNDDSLNPVLYKSRN
jgi:hypothetical protein